jgi:hypothetical protein
VVWMSCGLDGRVQQMRYTQKYPCGHKRSFSVPKEIKDKKKWVDQVTQQEQKLDCSRCLKKNGLDSLGGPLAPVTPRQGSGRVLSPHKLSIRGAFMPDSIETAVKFDCKVHGPVKSSVSLCDPAIPGEKNKLYVYCEKCDTQYTIEVGLSVLISFPA